MAEEYSFQRRMTATEPCSVRTHLVDVDDLRGSLAVSCLGRGIKLPPFCDQAVTVTRTLTLQRLGSRLPRPAAPLSADAGLPRSGVLAATVAGASPDPSTAAPSSASPLT